ncbi:MAG TPA: NAD(P)-binding protein, partial [Polyangia bacterium]
MKTTVRRRDRGRVLGRFALALLREFRGTLLTLVLAVGVGSLVFSLTHLRTPGGRDYSLGEAVFASWMALLGQPPFSVTEAWYILLIGALYPLLGLGVVVQGILRLGLLLLSRRRGDKDWMKIMASTYRNHVVLCGLGHLGYRILEELRRQGIEVVAIERDPRCTFLPQARESGTPILERDMKEDQALIDAGVPHARAMVIASNDDMANLEVALDARRMNPTIRVVMRLFDQQIAQKITAAFAVDVAFSASALAAPVVAGMVQPSTVLASFQVGGSAYITAEIKLEKDSPLQGLSVGKLESAHGVRALGFASDAKPPMSPPAPDRVLAVGDRLVLSGPAPA